MNAKDQRLAALDDPRVVEALEEYQAALEAGGRPSRPAFLARYPEVAAALDECLDGLDVLHANSSTAPPAVDESGRAAPAADWPPGTALGDFRIVREVGRGGMGVVYEAEQLSLGRRIALKVLPFALTLDPRQLQRFKNEARAAAQLHHQHIVPIYSVGMDRAVHFYAMQYVEGKSLAEVIRELRWLADRGPAADADGPSRPASTPTGPFGACPAAAAADTVTDAASALATAFSADAPRFFQTVAQLGVQAAEALEHAHQYGVIHRDVKPANLLVDVHGNLWVTDFGLAQFQSDAALTLSGDLLGTLRYMSPEQALAKRGLVDHRTDLYSLGATLYELVTLEPAYGGRDREEVLRQITFEEPRPPRRRNPAIPPDLETIILKAMAKAVEDRYATARALAEDLRRFLEHKPIKARRPSLVERGRKWVRRHQALVGTGLLTAVVALAVSTAVVVGEQAKTRAAYERERQKAQEADDSFRKAREAVDFFTQLMSEDLAHLPPPLQGVRQKALEASLAYYQGFIDQRRDDPSLQEDRERVSRFLDELTAMQGFGHVMRLADQSVRQDLDLSDAASKGLQQLGKQFLDEQRQLFSDANTLSWEERRQQFTQLALAHQNAVFQLLTPEQEKRLREIDIQLRGPMAFGAPDVIKALGLTPAQQEKVRLAQMNAFSGHCEPLPPGGRGRGGPKGFEPGWPGVPEPILAVLTPAQKELWRELTGRPFVGPGRFGFGPRRHGPPHEQPPPPMRGN